MPLLVLLPVCLSTTMLCLLYSLKKETMITSGVRFFRQYSSLKTKAFEQPKEVIKEFEAFLIRDVISFNLERLGWEFPEGEDYLTVELRSFSFRPRWLMVILRPLNLPRRSSSPGRTGDGEAPPKHP